MQISWWQDPASGSMFWKLEIKESEFCNLFLYLDPVDQALIEECNKSPSVADKLLALECIARKIEGARKAQDAPGTATDQLPGSL